MSKQIPRFCDMTPFSLVEIYRRLGGSVQLLRDKRSTKFCWENLRMREPGECITAVSFFRVDTKDDGCIFSWQFGTTSNPTASHPTDSISKKSDRVLPCFICGSCKNHEPEAKRPLREDVKFVSWAKISLIFVALGKIRFGEKWRNSVKWVGRHWCRCVFYLATLSPVEWVWGIAGMLLTG